MSSHSAHARVRRSAALSAGIAITLALATAERTAAATGPCVGAARACFATIQKAVDAAKDGDTIRLRAGTFAGGVTITKSVSIEGAGAGATTIRGGGPVVTIGALGAASEPSVAIRRVTITGGLTTGSPFPGFERSTAAGGGVFVPPGAGGSGATVTIADSVVAANRVAPAQSVSPADGGPQCPGIGRCPFAQAQGGGIASFGALTLERTVVAGNRAGSGSGLPDASSDADGGGIAAHGPLTVIDSAIVDNRAAASPPNGRFAEGAGIWSEGPRTTIRGGSLSRNVADLSSAFAREVEQLAVGGAMQITNADATTTFEGVTIADNRLLATNSAGDATAFAAGPHVFGTLVMRDSAVTGNRIVATVPAGAPGDAIATSAGIEIDDNGTVTGSRFEGNSAVATSPNNAVTGGAGIDLAPLDGEAATVTDSVVRGNTIASNAGSGSATAQGGGIQTIGVFALDRVTVERNTATATGPAGVAQGGGIWNATVVFDGAPPAPVLTLHDTTIRRNALQATAGIDAQGGGLFTDSPVTQDDARILANAPDDCFGC